jgi:spermidine/putrescine transport system substrate-binding protein
MMRPEIAKEVNLQTGFPIANKAGQQLLPDNIRNNKVIFPGDAIMKRGEFQLDVGEQALGYYDRYWTSLKMH